MSYLHGTPNFNLPQTVGTDPRDWSDTNECFADVDDALGKVVEESGDNKERIEQLENTATEHNTRITQLEGDMSTAKNDIDTLEQNVATLVGQTDAKFQDVYDMIDPDQEATATASHGYLVGERFIYNDTWYRCTVQIEAGDAIVPNVNCTSINVDSELRAIAQGEASDVSGLDQRVTALENASHVEIDDTTTSVDSVWSSDKVNTELGTKASASNVYTKAQVDALIAGIGGGMKRVQRGTVTLSGASGASTTVSISPVTMSKTFIITDSTTRNAGTGGSADFNHGIQAVLTDSSTITFTRIGGTGGSWESEIAWQAVEYE